LADSATRERCHALFEARGIARERVELLDWLPSRKAHLDLYGRIDIALDTFPYNGTTTTCEALWMGVPVITLAGDRHAARVGVSLLSRMGLTELVAQSPEEYVRLAVELAGDTDRLVQLRAGLRERMKNSGLCNAPAFTRDLEQSYREMWIKWCEQN
jgi:predicted O-linked N-acetylglucosamine transferase (SPINDLY family)